MLWPDLIWERFAGASDSVLEVLEGMRWAGAVLVAWAVGGMLVLSRPEGRQTMVTTFALQYTLAAAALMVSAVADEFFWAESWFVVLAIVVVGAVAAYLWYGRWAGRRVLTA
jgi:drug/metabolite transporter (DMT)-like permease